MSGPPFLRAWAPDMAATAGHERALTKGQAVTRKDDLQVPAAPNEQQRLAPGAAEDPPEFAWTVVTIDGAAGERLQDAQARAIKEVLLWARTQHRSRSNPSAGAE